MSAPLAEIKLLDLHDHPRQHELFQRLEGGAWTDFYTDINARGMTQPIIVSDRTGELVVADGHQRVRAARFLGWQTVPAVVVPFASELDEVRCLIMNNTQRRQLSREEIGQVIGYWLKTATHYSNRRIADEIGGIGKNKVEEKRQELEATGLIDQLDKLEGKDGKLRPRKLLQAGPLPEPNADIAETPLEAETPSYLTLKQWEQGERLEATPNKTTMNRVNDNIEWAAYSWNPVTGCRHDCAYCYARDIANRFYQQKFEPSFVPARLAQPGNTKGTGPRWPGDTGHVNVFTCSMADLFGKWVPNEWIEAVIEVAANTPEFNFLFLTKFPIRMAEFSYPTNVWLGTTVDRQGAVSRAERAFTKIKASGFEGVCWLSCEPMLEPLSFESLSMFDWVVMGGASKSSQTPEYIPPPDDVMHLHQQARAASCMIYQKTNLIPGMKDSQRLREYPQPSGYLPPKPTEPVAVPELPRQPSFAAAPYTPPPPGHKATETRKALKRGADALLRLDPDEAREELAFDPSGTLRGLLVGLLNHLAEIVAEAESDKIITLKADQA